MNHVLLTAQPPTKNSGTDNGTIINGMSVVCKVIYVDSLASVADIDIQAWVNDLSKIVDDLELVGQRFVHLQMIDAAIYDTTVNKLKAARFRVLVGPSRTALKEL